MNKGRILKGLLLVACCLILTGCNSKEVGQPVDEAGVLDIITPTAAITKEENEPNASTDVIENNAWEEKQRAYIYQQNPEYENYKEYTYQLEDAYITVYEAPDAKKEFMEYYGDIWAYGKDWVTQLEENAYISFNYGLDVINDKAYFRYDYSYVTDSQTVLIMLDEKDKLHKISLPGALVDVEGNDLTVTVSAYDMVYSKEEQYSCGHTWKPHYFKLDNYEIKEYEVHVIEEDSFLQYEGAKDILDQIISDYCVVEYQLSLGFLERENGLIHINIVLESTKEITYYYETYRISDKRLIKIDNGEGGYVQTPDTTIDEMRAPVFYRYVEMDESKLCYILDYNEDDNRITIQNIGWLAPWSEEDKPRIQELLDAGKISIGEDIWGGEYYIYTEEGNDDTYQLSEDIKILLRTDASTWEEFDIGVLIVRQV